MDVEFIIYVGLMLCAALVIAALPIFLYFEVVCRLSANVSNPMVTGLVGGLIWGILFMSYTVHRSSAVGSAMAAPVIIIGFPIVGLIIGMFYEKRKKPLIGSRKCT